MSTEIRSSLTIWHLTGHRSGQSDRFRGARIAIGRGSANHLAFDPLEDRSVSHRHCEIRCEEEGVMIYDVGSLNGTFVNGERVRRTTLSDGDEVGLGRDGPRLRITMTTGDSGCFAVVDDTVRASGPATMPVPPQGTKRWSRGTMLAAIVGASFLIALGGLSIWNGLDGRLDRLEDDPSAGGGGTASTLDPPHLSAGIDGPRATSFLIHGVVRAPDGRVMARRELGFAVSARPRVLLTASAVLDDCQRFLELSRDDVLVARLEASSDCDREPFLIEGYWSGAELSGPSRLMAALELDRTVPRPVATLPSRPGAPAELCWHPPAQPQQRLQVAHALNIDGFRAVEGEAIATLRFDDLPSEAGTPLFDATGSLVAVVAGAARPRQAVGPEIIRGFLDRVRRERAQPF